MAGKASSATQRQSAQNVRRISVYDMGTLDWVASGPPGVWQQDIRSDRSAGRYFGGVRFEPFARSGVHRHLGPAASYMLSGTLTDHASHVVGGQAFINMTGAVHDVICYAPVLNVARVDGAILYPGDEDGVLNELGLQAAEAGESIDTTIGQAPNLCITVDALVPVPGPVPGAARRLLYDYANEDWQARYCQLLLAPGTTVPMHRTTGMTDLFVISGEVSLGGEPAGSGAYVVIDAETELSIESHYGARVLAWADGPVQWSDATGLADLYGY